MPNAHIRDIGASGIIADPDAYDLPINAWSRGVNVRFRNGKVSRGPVFRTADAMGAADPRWLAVSNPSSGFDTMFFCHKSGSVRKWIGGTEALANPGGFAPNDSESPFTTCIVGDVLWLNRDDRLPWHYGPSASAFSNITTTTGWASTTRAKLIRGYQGAIIALNVTKAGTNYPTMVKTSEFAVSGTEPSTWDHTDPANNATENILGDMRGPIVDACNLRNTLCIYGAYETWEMLFDGSEFVYSFRRLFDAAGAINANCSVEVDGLNYVFGTDDIWAHDGSAKQSICEGAVREFIFNSIDKARAERCFVYHNIARKEIKFYYVSGDELVNFDPGLGEGANRSAVYDYVNRTWSFDDEPYIMGAVNANADTLLTYTTVDDTYESIGSTYLDQGDGLKRTTFAIGDVSSTYGLIPTLYANEPQGPGSVVAYPVDTDATQGWYLERTGIDLDEVAADLNGYKLLSTIYPQARLESGADAIEFSVGATDYANEEVIWSDYQTYDGDSLYKLDFNVAGRFLAIRIRHDDYHWTTLSGFDLDLDILGER
jgi:hypothetical protein